MDINKFLVLVNTYQVFMKCQKKDLPIGLWKRVDEYQKKQAETDPDSQFYRVKVQP